MKKVEKLNLSEVKKVASSKSVKRKSPGNGTAQNPYTEAQYNDLVANNQWEGGYVIGLGYISKDAVISTNGAIVEVYKGVAINYAGSDGVGIQASFNFYISSRIENGKLYTSALYYQANSQFVFSARMEVYVDNKKVLSMPYTSTPSYSDPNYCYIGTADIDLTKYHGHVVIEVLYYGQGTNCNTAYRATIYDNNR